MPELVRAVTSGDTPMDQATLSVIYEDLIAVLTLVLQEQNERIELLEGLAARTSAKLLELEAKLAKQDLMTAALNEWIRSHNITTTIRVN